MCIAKVQLELFTVCSISMTCPGMITLFRTERYCTKLADEVMKLRGEKSFMDFKIHTKDDEFSCAKFIMAAQSPMLRAMLTSDTAEVAKQEIRLDHIHKDIIQIILDYMYCEDVRFYKDHLMDLIAAADYLQMTELKQMGLDEVPDILEPGNVISWWKEASKMNYISIKEQCEVMMAAKFEEISEQIDFLNLDLNDLNHYILDICSDTVNSDDTLDILIRWVSHDEERITFLEDLLATVQSSKCSEERIHIVVKTHEALFDKVPMAYKLLLQTSADATTETSETLTDSVVVVGGQQGDEASEVCWKVNNSAEIVQLCDIPGDDLGINASVCMAPQGFVVTGGSGSSMCIIFMASTRSWIRLPDMLTTRRCHGTICIHQVLYVLGGCVGIGSDDSEPSTSVDSLAMERGVWVNGPGLPQSVKFPKVSNLGDRVYLLDQTSSQLVCLDIDKKAWRSLSPLPVKGDCRGVSMASAREWLFVAGGLCKICSWYKPETNTWCMGQQPLKQHKYGALAYNNDKILLLGGSYMGGTDEVEEYDIDENKWSVCSYKMPEKLYRHHAVVLSMSEIN